MRIIKRSPACDHRTWTAAAKTSTSPISWFLAGTIIIKYSPSSNSLSYNLCSMYKKYSPRNFRVCSFYQNCIFLHSTFKTRQVRVPPSLPTRRYILYLSKKASQSNQCSYFHECLWLFSSINALWWFFLKILGRGKKKERRENTECTEGAVEMNKRSLIYCLALPLLFTHSSVIDPLILWCPYWF